MKLYKVFGAVFIIISGLIYTLERGFSMLSTSLIRAGFFSGGMGGEIPEVEVNTLFSNLYVPLFLIIGLILVVYGFLKK
ncbi:hypothetical protein ACIQ2D_21225 [Lysinibacillus sp. NPDC097287]|uniref:hypothetical protein n=1 Tax=Lysinibacillus sp. NPDC097287 TaxID=3364144 RepID=UPI0037FBCAE9